MSPEGPVSQIHSHHLLIGAPGIFSHLLKSVQTLKREFCLIIFIKVIVLLILNLKNEFILNMLYYTESNGKLPHLFIPSKTAISVPEFAVKLQNCSLGAWVCSARSALGQNTDDDEILIIFWRFISLLKYWWTHPIKSSTSRHWRQCTSPQSWVGGRHAGIGGYRAYAVANFLTGLKSDWARVGCNRLMHFLTYNLCAFTGYRSISLADYEWMAGPEDVVNLS